MATAVLVTNWGGASFMDAAYMSMLQHRNLVQNDNTSAVNAWINAESSQWQDINQQIRQVIYNPTLPTVQLCTISWGTILAGAGIGGLLDWVLEDDGPYAAALQLHHGQCREVVLGDQDGNSRVTSTIIGAGLGALMAYLVQPTLHVVPNPAAGRDRYLAELAWLVQFRFATALVSLVNMAKGVLKASVLAWSINTRNPIGLKAYAEEQCGSGCVRPDAFLA